MAVAERRDHERSPGRKPRGMGLLLARSCSPARRNTRAWATIWRASGASPAGSVEKDYAFDTDDGKRTLAEPLGRPRPTTRLPLHVRPQLPGWLSDLLIDGRHHRRRPPAPARGDVTMLFVSQAPLEKLQAYRRRMGWNRPWVSSAGGDFNFDLGYSLTEEQTRGGFAPMLEAGTPATVDLNARSSGTDVTAYLSQGARVQRLRPRRRHRVPDVRDHGPRSRVPDGLLRDPRPRTQGPRRRRRLILGPPPRRVLSGGGFNGGEVVCIPRTGDGASPGVCHGAISGK